MMTNNVINFSSSKPTPGRATPCALEINVSTLTVGEDVADRETHNGFVTISNGEDTSILVFSSEFPTELISELVAWRAGHASGLERGRRASRHGAVS